MYLLRLVCLVLLLANMTFSRDIELEIHIFRDKREFIQASSMFYRVICNSRHTYNGAQVNGHIKFVDIE